MARARAPAHTGDMSKGAHHPDHWDAVIVGARCAGATLAAYLGRAGAKVLLVDQSPLPSDQVLSTHTLHPASLRVLDELGLSQRMHEVTPPIGLVRIGRGRGTLDLPLAGDSVEYCPRRERFDGLLQERAREASVEVWDRTSAKELVERDGRAVGVRLEGPRGARVVHADWIIGADGRSSWLARQVSAEEYLTYDAPRGMYWSYWRAPRAYGRCNDYPAGMYVANRTGMIRVAFHTDHDQVLVGCLPERRELRRFKSDPLRALQADLENDAMLASFTRQAPETKVRGYMAQRYFFRRAAGPGWLLVGDAGVHEDFVTGHGMTEALLQARSAAAALLQGEAAVASWGRSRDRAALPYFIFGKLQGAPGAPSQLDALVMERANHDAAIRRRFEQSLRHEISPLEVVRLPQVLSWVFPELLRGRFGLLGDLARRVGVVSPLVRAMARAHPAPERESLLSRSAAPVAHPRSVDRDRGRADEAAAASPALRDRAACAATGGPQAQVKPGCGEHG